MSDREEAQRVVLSCEAAHRKACGQYEQAVKAARNFAPSYQASVERAKRLPKNKDVQRGHEINEKRAAALKKDIEDAEEAVEKTASDMKAAVKLRDKVMRSVKPGAKKTATKKKAAKKAAPAPAPAPENKPAEEKPNA